MSARGRVRLRVVFEGRDVALWERRAGLDTLSYDAAWLAASGAFPISLSLPLLPFGEAHRGPVVSSWFENLLPDDETERRRMARRFGAASTQAMDLLAATGRDCAGAFEILEEEFVGTADDEAPLRLMSEADVARMLEGLRRPDMVDPFPGIRLSLAGAHAKTALVLSAEGWRAPAGATPSTHILKPPLGILNESSIDMSSSVENEWLCAELVRELGLPAATSWIARFEGERALVVERFDRRDGKRVPIEDTCQALGLPSQRKYEQDGGPGIAAICNLLAMSDAPTDRETFYATQIVFWLLAATDGHAKNFSIFLGERGRFRSTPLYDVLSVHPSLGRGAGRVDPHRAALAMSVSGKNKHWKLKDMKRRHWNEMAKRCGLRKGAEPMIARLIDVARPAAERVRSRLPADFPGEIAEAILRGFIDAADRLAEMPSE